MNKCLLNALLHGQGMSVVQPYFMMVLPYILVLWSPGVSLGFCGDVLRLNIGYAFAQCSRGKNRIMIA